MKQELTPTQRRVLEFVEARVLNGENSPTYREICTHFGYSSPKAAADHVAALERKGYLSRQRNRARSMRSSKENLGIPLLGRIRAGYPEAATAEPEARIPLDPIAFGIRDSSKAFALQVTGDSMIGHQLREGDIVLFEEGKAPRNGDIVAALIDNECTLKMLVRRNGAAWLEAANPLYPSLIPVLGLTIQGVACAVIRMLNK